MGPPWAAAASARQKVGPVIRLSEVAAGPAAGPVAGAVADGTAATAAAPEPAADDKAASVSTPGVYERVARSLSGPLDSARGLLGRGLGRVGRALSWLDDKAAPSARVSTHTPASESHESEESHALVNDTARQSLDEVARQSAALRRGAGYLGGQALWGFRGF